MNETKTTSILQRLPVILAVTAASYGLNVSQAQTPAGNQNQTKARTAAPSIATVKPAR
jgi:hypothetical protein